MANETTSTSQAALIATEVLMQGAIQANLPRLVVMNQLHWDDISAEGSGTVNYPVEADPGSASGGTEGTALTTNTEIGMGTTVQVSPTEGAVFRAMITETVVKRRLGGMPYNDVIDVFQSNDVNMLQALLAPDIRRGTVAMLNKIETDCIALVDDASAVVGDGAANDAKILDLFSATFQMLINQPLRPPSEWKFILCPHQIHEVNLDAAVTNGGIGGAVWNMQANYGLAGRPTDALMSTGQFGSFLNYPVFAYDHELRLEATNAAKGCFIAGGSPEQNPRDPALAGRVGYGVLVWEAPLRFRFQYQAASRAMEIIGSTRYGAKELVDKNGVTISTDDY